MKSTARLRSFLALSGSTLLAISCTHAANIWDGGGGDGNWTTLNNWDNNALPGTGALTFVGDIQTITNNDRAAALSYGGINFTNDGSSGKTSGFTLGGSSSITLNGNITTTANTEGSTFTDVISLAMILNNNRSITTNQLSDTVQHNLTISGSISETGGARGLTKLGGGVLTLSGQNSYTGTTTVSLGTLRAGAAANGQAFGLGSAVSLSNTAGVTLDLNNFDQTIGSLAGGGATGGNVTLGSATLTVGTNNTATQYSGIISGSGGLIKTGSNILTLQAVSLNSYQGGTRIDGGLLLINVDGNLGEAGDSITLNGGGLGVGAIISTNRGMVLNNVAGNLVRLQGNQSWTTTGAVTGDGGVIFRQNPNGGVTANLNSQSNDFKGALGIESGNGGIAVRLRSMADSATANGNIVYGLSSGVTNSQIFEWDSAAGSSLTLANRKFEFAQNGAAWGTIKNSHATNAVTVNTNLVVSGTGTKTLILDAVDGPRNAFNGNITDGSGTVALSKVGAGDWVLGGTNSYTGGSAITAGGLTFLQTGAKSSTGTHAFSSGTMLGLGVSGASGFTDTDIINAFAGGTLTGNLAGITVTTGTNVGIDTTHGDFTLASNIASTAKQLHKLGNNTLTLTGTNANTGVAIAKQGTLQYGTTASLSSSVAGRLSARSGATLAFNVGGAGEFNAAGITTILNNQTASSGLTNGMNAGSSLGFDTTNATGTFTIANAIVNTTGVSGGSRGLTKLGTGTLELTSASSTYTGATTVNAGTLIVNGNISTSTLTTVKSGATLGGIGTVGALTIDSGGFFSPGNSPGIETVNGNYIQNGTLQIEIEGDTAGNGAGFHDQVIVNGTVTLGGTLSLLSFSGAYVTNDLMFILLNDGTDAITNTFSGLAQGATVTTYGGFDWIISYNADSTANTFTGTANGNDIALMAIPEPGATLLGSLGLLALLRRRRN